MSRFTMIALVMVSALLMSVHVEGANVIQPPMLRSEAGFSRQLSFWSWLTGKDSSETTCPEVDPVDNFNLTKYTEKSWFIQAQQVTKYQTEEYLNCVVATYIPNDGYVEVYNYGTTADQSEIQQSGDGFFQSLCARQVDSGTGNLEVTLCALRYLGWVGAGPYTVILIDDDYEWAVVSGGQPTEVEQTDPILCTTKTDTTNDSGLWIFTRAQERDDDLIDDIMAQLEDMGVYTGLLIDVPQANCTYKDATLKL
mmetsp:Transcript_12863/g.24969  ORF Transcript_12863/g.24969 Transcript_12863/m.24969 type:complete len:253 (+) Transcript_12863:353-1111(+)